MLLSRGSKLIRRMFPLQFGEFYIVKEFSKTIVPSAENTMRLREQHWTTLLDDLNEEIKNVLIVF